MTQKIYEKSCKLNDNIWLINRFHCQAVHLDYIIQTLLIKKLNHDYLLITGKVYNILQIN